MSGIHSATVGVLLHNSEGTATGRGTKDLGTAFLAAASGGSDVIAFLMLGHVFASAMTGNTALLGIALSRGDLAGALLPITALTSFVLGAVVGSVIYNPNATARRRHATLRGLVGLEVACLAGFALIWQIVGHPADGFAQYALIMTSAFAMGVQGIAAKIINAPGVNTIVFTSTLVAIVLSLTEFLLGRRDSPEVRAATWRQIEAFLAYALGAVIAGLLYWADFGLLVWVPMAAAIMAWICFETTSAPRARSDS